MNQPINEDVIRDYCLHHELSRPIINIKKVLMVFCLMISIAIVLSYALCLLVGFSFLLWFDIVITLFVLMYGKTILKFFVHCYQRYASESTRRQCSCMPSCSEYALLSLDKYNWPKALYKTWRRVTITCSKPGYHVDFP